ncbi:hypothetical protein CC86DRAFT_462939 [Ophiobolus disseminans]|uniref:Uncharacterized protein n=1 Tax=Ophiobolus disseminans TaxID=1469910 RepID=A0A6A7AJF6_9PLEO|nr:hypothetical protein CC86DRAFT_462939 [Ophiobolus disseminans]
MDLDAITLAMNIFPFLELAPELRNSIYEYAAIGNDETLRISKSTGKPGSFAALSRVGREIRAEYRPIQRREANVEIRWNNLEAYQEDFLRTKNDRSSPPRFLRVTMGRNRYDTVGVDILPLVLTQLRDPSLDCYFTQSKNGEGIIRSCLVRQARRIDEPMDQGACLTNLLHHFLYDKTWVADLQSGRIANIMVRRGHNVRIKFVPGKEPAGLAVWLAEIAIEPRWGKGIYDLIQSAGHSGVGPRNGRAVRKGAKSTLKKFSITLTAVRRLTCTTHFFLLSVQEATTDIPTASCPDTLASARDECKPASAPRMSF